MVRKFTLLRSQRNQVFEMLREAGLEPAEFSWGKEQIAGDMIVSRLNYRDEVHYFQFSAHEVNSWCVFCPGMYRSLEYDYPKNWNEQQYVFRNWTSYLKRETEIPDFWNELAKYRAAIGVEPPEEMLNEPISACEAERIRETLGRLAGRVGQEFQLDGDGLELVFGRLNYLAEAARRARCKDWVYTALGVCAVTAMALSLSQDKAAVLWRLLEDEVGWFVHLTAGPLECSKKSWNHGVLE